MPRSSTPLPPARLTARRSRSRHAAPGTPSGPLASSLLALLGVLATLVLQALPASAAPAVVASGAAIEVLSPYQSPSTCDPVVRPGVKALRDLVLASYPDTRDSGIVRSCSVGGVSEHKEGRAWDWRVSASNPTHVAEVQDFLDWLLATDDYGNTAAMARRLGIMYVIWDSKIWKSYQSAKGWQPYYGASPHTDHVHISLSWAGALGRTSYWTGTVAPVLGPPVKAPLVSDTATATITVGVAPVVDRRVQRRFVVGRMSGPWRRH